MADFGPTGVLLMDPAGGVCMGLFPEPASIPLPTLANFVFLTGLSEMMRARGLYPVHAAGLARKGRGILIPGLSGSGKTTLCLALMRGGFQFLSDDRPILKRDSDGFKLLSFPKKVNVTDQTISFFPEVSGLPPDTLVSGISKRHFPVDRLYPHRIIDSCIPKVILFPHIVKQEISRLTPISKTAAAEALLPHSLFVMDRAMAERQFHFLCELVEKTDCFRLDFGGDVLEVHKRVRDII
jgi:hypothetical protein